MISQCPRPKPYQIWNDYYSHAVIICDDCGHLLQAPIASPFSMPSTLEAKDKQARLSLIIQMKKGTQYFIDNLWVKGE